VAVERQEGLLRDVVGQIVVAEEAIEEPPDGVVVAAEEGIEAALVA
jgi:hypothetical protein